MGSEFIKKLSNLRYSSENLVVVQIQLVRNFNKLKLGYI